MDIDNRPETFSEAHSPTKFDENNLPTFLIIIALDQFGWWLHQRSITSLKYRPQKMGWELTSQSGAKQRSLLEFRSIVVRFFVDFGYEPNSHNVREFLVFLKSYCLPKPVAVG